MVARTAGGGEVAGSNPVSPTKISIKIMETATYIGLSAGICGIASVIPQVVKVVKTKSTRDLALFMWIIVTFANGLWTTYGIMQQDIPIIISNGSQFVLVAIVLRYKLKYG